MTEQSRREENELILDNLKNRARFIEMLLNRLEDGDIPPSFIITADSGSKTLPPGKYESERMVYAVEVDSDFACRIGINDMVKTAYRFPDAKTACDIAGKFKAHNGHGDIKWYVVTLTQFLTHQLEQTLYSIGLFELVVIHQNKQNG